MGSSIERRMEATVFVVIEMEKGTDAITRVTGPGGDEWRAQMYELYTEKDVLAHWTFNAIANGIRDACELDGWADLEAETVVFRMEEVVTD